MNASSRLISLLGAASLLALASGLGWSVLAGPSPQFFPGAKPVTKSTEAAALKSDAAVAMACGTCKNVQIRASRHVGPLGKGYDEWFVIGSKHACGGCGGEITVVKGRTTDSMQHNCSKCGEGAASCCVLPGPKATETKK